MGMLGFAVDWVSVSCIGFHNPYHYAFYIRLLRPEYSIRSLSHTMRELIEKAKAAL
jgi:hypothetical protein